MQLSFHFKQLAKSSRPDFLILEAVVLAPEWVVFLIPFIKHIRMLHILAFP
jgi:hypothetical protein